MVIQPPDRLKFSGQKESFQHTKDRHDPQDSHAARADDDLKDPYDRRPFGQRTAGDGDAVDALGMDVHGLSLPRIP